VSISKDILWSELSVRPVHSLTDRENALSSIRHATF